MSLDKKQFASDNYAPIAPEAWEALMRANSGHAGAYGADRWTDRAVDMLKQVFETDCSVYFVFNGTAANALALASMCQPFNSIICHELAHIQTDECGAPEMFTGGAKLLTVGGDQGKFSTSELEAAASSRKSDVHWSRPAALSVTQGTEMGTLYSVEELAAIVDIARRNGLGIHMDGARFANAVGALDVAPREISSKIGIDVLSLGGTKLGNPMGDVLLFFNPVLAKDFQYRRKQAGQLASKMRFLSAPWIGMLEDGAWLRHARHANTMAQLLAAEISGIVGVDILMPVQVNAVFARMPKAVINQMHDLGWVFYTFIGDDGVRLMCSWDTLESDIEEFSSSLRACMGAVL